MSPAPRSRNRRSCLPGFLLIVLLVLAIVMAVVLARIPAEAASIFGEPAPGLGTFDRLSLSIKLLSNQASLMTPRNPAGAAGQF